MKYLTAEQARKQAGLTKKEKRRISRRIKEIVGYGFSHIKHENCKEYSKKYKDAYIQWLSELGYLAYYDQETDTIYTYWNAEDIPQ